MQRIDQPESGMNRRELRTALSLSSVYALRMLGLFMILPVFALYATDLEDVTPLLIGLAIGVYGLTQAVLQIPAGLLSDRIGRKPVIIGGLLVFALGSMLAALADSMAVVIIGRALQGAGAIAAAIMALAADLTREQHRIKVMALIGMSIGLSFVVALVLGPVLNNWVGVPGIFAITAVLALGGILVVMFVVPQPVVSRPHSDAEAIPAQFARVLRQTQLLRLDFGILMLHTILMASFVVLPLILRDQAGVAASAHGTVYLLVLLCSVLAMLPLIILAGRKGRTKPVFLFAIALLMIAELGLFVLPVTLYTVVFMMFMFFTAFNLLEAMLPSLVSRLAPADCRGTAMGFYSSSQFLGAFLGGALGGLLHQYAGAQAVFLGGAVGAGVWLLLALPMSRPDRLSNYTYKIDASEANNVEQLTQRLRVLAGVAEAVVVAEEGVAYLKVDKQVFDEASLP